MLEATEEVTEVVAASQSTETAIGRKNIGWDSVLGPVNERREATLDAIADPRGVRAELAENAENENLPKELRVQLAVQTPNGKVTIGILPGAHDQLGDKLQVPRQYYERMFNTAPQLLVQNMNHWFANSEPEGRMLRMFRPITAEQQEQAAAAGTMANLRAYLSNSYRALDHGSLIDTVVPEALGRGAVPTDAVLDDQRFRLKVMMVERNVKDLIAGHQTGHIIGEANEIVSFGVLVTNSETGHASLKVEPIMTVLRCWNGYVMSVDTLRVMHLGRKEKEERWGDDTKRLDDATTFLKVRDRVREVLGDGTATMMARKMIEAKGVPLPVEIPLTTFIDSVSAKMDLREDEVELLKGEVMGEAAFERVHTGSITPTAWTLAQGLTAVARQQTNNERKIELETVGWRVLDDPSAFLRAAIAKTPRRGAKVAA